MNRTRASSLDAFGTRDQRNRIYPTLEASDGSTLSLDFTQMASLDSSRFTFTRNSTATYINSSGYVTGAAVNAPRFDYDPTTLTPRGLLVEGSASNLLTYSEAFTPDWTDTNISRNGTPRTSPNGTANALRVTASAGNATIIRTSAIGTSAERTFSVWLRRVAGTGNIEYTQNNGTNWTTQMITSSWVRYTFTHTVFHQAGIRIVTNGDEIEIWGAQLEGGVTNPGIGASSYIPTVAVSVSRSADQLTMSNISALGYSTTAGTFYYSGRFTQSNTTSYPVRIGFMTAIDQPVWEVFTNASRLFAAARGGTGPEAKLSFILNTQSRFAASFDASLSTGEVKINLNGSALSSTGSTSLGATLTPTRLVIGRPNYEQFFPAGTIAQIKYWPVTKSATELNLLTTT